MSRQEGLVDKIQRLTPSQEEWEAGPLEERPATVTVELQGGRIGRLDMTYPLAAHWARAIDHLQKSNRPVYVEVDEETQVITNFQMPFVLKVHALEPNTHGNVLVKLLPNPTVHILLKSNPRFDELRTTLQTAHDDDAFVLVTATRDEHEIIDVRLPDEEPEEPQEGDPPPPDPPISEDRARELFDIMNSFSCVPCSPSSNCITFLYPDNCCHARANKMCHKMIHDHGEDPEKVWIQDGLVVYTANHPDCFVSWWYHVAPTHWVTASGGDERWVFDPSLTDEPVTVAAWAALQNPTNETISHTPWTQFTPSGGTDPDCVSTDNSLADHRVLLEGRCLDFGPPPYSCTKNCFFIVDRSNFSLDEVEAMLLGGSPAVVEAAFYVVVDGFSPYELGFSDTTMSETPNLDVAPVLTGITLDPVSVDFEYPAHLNRRQRVTWTYRILFDNANDFDPAVEVTPVTLTATMETETGTAHLYLMTQPNPYEIDGATSWLSTDLRVFQIENGQSRFNVSMGSDPSAFITGVISNLNSGNTAGQTFESDISTDQQSSQLELSQTVGGTPVYNFAVAKVRYRAEAVDADNVRVFFRQFAWATTTVDFNLTSTYRRHEDAGGAIALLGIHSSNIVSIPFFAAPRIDSSTKSMTEQTDPANVQTIPHDSGGAEVVRYFGCWLDFNQTQLQFPRYPTGDGPFPAADRIAIQDLVMNQHQCLISEIAFDPAPIPTGAGPGTSDKLAQRNLAIVLSANPGLVASRRIPLTFEVRPSAEKVAPDELMIDWGNVPTGSFATFFVPGINTDEVVKMAARRYRSHRLVRIDKNTLKCETGGITYIPLPANGQSLPGLLTIDLPETIEYGQAFTVVVRQVASEKPRFSDIAAHTGPSRSWRHIVGSFQLTIPVSKKEEMLVREARLLSNLRWILQSLPTSDRWQPVFQRYVLNIANRVDALGGDSGKVEASADGQWLQARRRCLFLAVVTTILVGLFVIGVGTLPGGWQTLVDLPYVVLVILLARYWLRICRPGVCRLLKILLAGAGVGAIALAILAALGVSTPQIWGTAAAGAVAAATSGVVGWMRGCFSRRT